MTDVEGGWSADQLLVQGAWLHALARRLVQDPSRAEDAVQETLLAALQSRGPKSGAGSSSVRVWLAAILRNVLRQEHRRDAARERREAQSAASLAVPGTADVVARAQGQRALVQAILDLEEPLRVTVLRRYFDGLSSAQIAAEQGLAASTVRTRLQRALVQLREKLETEEPRGLLALAGAPVLSSSPSAASAITPAFFMSLNLQAALAVGLTGLLLLGSWIVLEDSTSPSPAVVEPRGTGQPMALAEASVTDQVRTTLEVAAPEPAVERKAASPVGVPEAPLLPGRLDVWVLLDEQPVSQGLVHTFRGGHNAYPKDFARTNLELRSAPIGADGWARLDGLESGFTNVAVLLPQGHRQYVQPTLQQDEGTYLVVRLHSTQLQGHVYDGWGVPVAGARVFVDGEPNELQCSTWTDAAGAYSLQGMPPGELELIAMRSGHHYLPAGGEVRTLTLGAGEKRRVDFGRPEGWPRWTGAVLDEAGSQVPFPKTPGRSTTLMLESAEKATSYQLPIGEDGSIELALAPGEYSVSLQT